MSALWAPLIGWRESAMPDSVPAVPKLRAVPKAPARMARIPFILVVMALFGMGMSGLLMLNTTLQNQAFEARTLNRQATELAYSQADLETQISRLAAPQELARRASQLGLRANPRPAFLELPSGKIVGKATPVTGNEMPSLIIKTPAQLRAERAAARAKALALAVKQAADARAAAAKAAADKAAAKKAADQKAADRRAVDNKKSNGGRG